jgi:hypothetical protein
VPRSRSSTPSPRHSRTRPEGRRGRDVGNAFGAARRRRDGLERLSPRFGWTRVRSEVEAGSRRGASREGAAGAVMESSRPSCRGASLGGCGRWRGTTSRVAPRGVPFVSFCRERRAGFVAQRAARRPSRVPAEPRRRRKWASGRAPYPRRSRGNGYSPDRPATSRIAATMFGYAPHRQRLPLMNSRISSSDPALPSSSSATADMICPGVQ